MDRPRRKTAAIYYLDEGESYAMDGVRHRLLSVFREGQKFSLREFRVLACLPRTRFDPASEMMVYRHAEVTCLGCLAA